MRETGHLREGELERVAGIEPAYSAWKAAALPLSYTRLRARLCRAGCYSNQERRATRRNASQGGSGGEIGIPRTILG